MTVTDTVVHVIVTPKSTHLRTKKQHRVMLFEKNCNNEGKVASTLGKVFALLSQVGLEVTPPICKWDSALFAKFL